MDFTFFLPACQMCAYIPCADSTELSAKTSVGGIMLQCVDSKVLINKYMVRSHFLLVQIREDVEKNELSAWAVFRLKWKDLPRGTFITPDIPHSSRSLIPPYTKRSLDKLIDWGGVSTPEEAGCLDRVEPKRSWYYYSSLTDIAALKTSSLAGVDELQMLLRCLFSFDLFNCELSQQFNLADIGFMDMQKIMMNNINDAIHTEHTFLCFYRSIYALICQSHNA